MQPDQSEGSHQHIPGLELRIRRQRLGERDAKEHRRSNHAGSLRLTRHRLDGVAGHDADADPRADGSEAVIVGGRVTGTVFRGSVNGLDPVASTPSGLFGVSVLADGRTLVSGVRGFLAAVGPEVDEFQLLDVPNEHLLHAVWTTPGEFAYAVGGNLQSSIGPYRGTLLVARAPEGTR